MIFQVGKPFVQFKKLIDRSLTRRRTSAKMFNKSLTASEVMELLKETKKTKKTLSANKCRICFIAWLKYKMRFKADWAQCDECDGWICGEIA
uniref:Uncharacterized protein n=1 Tax=Romanomermis culicivorax TaxID=13658 RepID=A0A915I105_ROMCU